MDGKLDDAAGAEEKPPPTGGHGGRESNNAGSAGPESAPFKNAPASFGQLAAFAGATPPSSRAGPAFGQTSFGSAFAGASPPVSRAGPAFGQTSFGSMSSALGAMKPVVPSSMSRVFGQKSLSGGPASFGAIVGGGSIFDANAPMKPWNLADTAEEGQLPKSQGEKPDSSVPTQQLKPTEVKPEAVVAAKPAQADSATAGFVDEIAPLPPAADIMPSAEGVEQKPEVGPGHDNQLTTRAVPESAAESEDEDASKVLTLVHVKETEPCNTSELRLLQLANDVSVRVAEEPLGHDTPFYVSLLAVSSAYGYLVAATTQGFIYAETMLVRALARMGSHRENRLTEAVSVAIAGGAVRHVCLSADNRTVIVNVQGGRILLYVAERLRQKITEAKAEYNIGKEIICVQPNPRDDRISILFDDGIATVLDAQGNSQMSIHKCQASSLCWSPDGEQLVLGLASGTVEVRDLRGALVASVRKPSSLDSEAVVAQNVLQLDNTTFIVVYALAANPDPEDPVHDERVFVVTVDNGGDVTFHDLVDYPSPPYGVTSRRAHYHMQYIKSWDNWRHLVFLANSPSIDLGLVGHNQDGWRTWLPDEASCISLPLPSRSGEVLEDFPVGMAIDMGSSDELPPINMADSDIPEPPVPILILMAGDGVLVLYHVQNVPAMIKKLRPEGMITMPKSKPAVAGVTSTKDGQLTIEDSQSLPFTPAAGGAKAGTEQAGALTEPGPATTPVLPFAAPTTFGPGFSQSSTASAFAQAVTTLNATAPPTAPGLSFAGTGSTSFSKTQATEATKPAFSFAAQTQADTPDVPFAGLSAATRTAEPAAAVATTTKQVLAFAPPPTSGKPAFSFAPDASSKKELAAASPAATQTSAAPEASDSPEIPVQTTPAAPQSPSAATAPAEIPTTPTALMPTKAIPRATAAPLAPAKPPSSDRAPATTDTSKSSLSFGPITAPAKPTGAMAAGAEPSAASAPKSSFSLPAAASGKQKPAALPAIGVPSAPGKPAVGLFGPAPFSGFAAGVSPFASAVLGASKAAAPSAFAPVQGVQAPKEPAFGQEPAPQPTAAAAVTILPEAKSNPLAKEFEQTYAELERELEGLRAEVARSEKEIAGAAVPRRQEGNLPPPPSMSNLNDLQDGLHEMLASTNALLSNASALQTTAVQLGRDIAASSEQYGVEEHIAALRNPGAERSVRISRLGPEQANSRARLRSLIEVVESRLDELQRLIVQAHESGHGPSPAHRPVARLDTIHRAISNISQSARNRDAELLELERQIELLGIAGPGLRSAALNRSISPAASGWRRSSHVQW